VIEFLFGVCAVFYFYLPGVLPVLFFLNLLVEASFLELTWPPFPGGLKPFETGGYNHPYSRLSAGVKFN
jgi:hypothetical protein